MILNKKITSLKPILDAGLRFIATLPEDIRRLETMSRERIDDMFKEYASKALHFRKKPAATDCLNAALLHAEIFKEGNFYPPDQVPPINMWIPNNWVSIWSPRFTSITVVSGEPVLPSDVRNIH